MAIACLSAGRASNYMSTYVVADCVALASTRLGNFDYQVCETGPFAIRK